MSDSLLEPASRGHSKICSFQTWRLTLCSKKKLNCHHFFWWHQRLNLVYFNYPITFALAKQWKQKLHQLKLRILKLNKEFKKKKKEERWWNCTLKRKRRWCCGFCAVAVSFDGLWFSLRETSKWREKVKEEKCPAISFPLCFSLSHMYTLLLIFCSSIFSLSSSFIFSSLSVILLSLHSYVFLSFFHLSSSSLFNTLPSPLHLDFMPHMCFLFSPSLCSKVELMNDRACHQFPSFPLHLSYTHTHTVYWSVKQQQQQLCVFSPVKPLLLFPLSQFWVSWNNIYWLHN